MKKKILILETAVSYHGIRRAGSYIQATYYNNLLSKKGYMSKVYIKEENTNKYLNILKIINEISKTDYVIGFGTPLLNFHLQWLSFIFNKRGIFCVDTIIVPIPIINDHIKKKIYNFNQILLGLFNQLINNVVIKIAPPKMLLINISSCKYVREELNGTRFYPAINKFLYPKVSIDKKIINNKGVKHVLFYGMLFRGRGVIDLFTACRILWNKGYKFKLIFLGWPVDELTKKRLVEKMSDKEARSIIIRGKEENILKFVKESTAVVLPFRYPCSFQTPYTLLEPMGLGVPVITTDVGSHTEWVTHGETGLICKKENPQDIADKIETIFTDSKLVAKITQGAINLLKKRYKEEDLLLKTLRKLEDET